MSGKPVFYVHGNHDTDYQYNPPWGCDCIDDAIVEYNGVRFLGLGGCRKYHPGRHQYTEAEMRRRIRRLWFQLWYHKGFDILVTHAPAYGVNDLDDLPHRGFQCFLKLLEKYKPKYFIHGHVHRNYGIKIPRVCKREETTIVNAFEYYAFDY
jgi:Icc-related predicted phosphoesterase